MVKLSAIMIKLEYEKRQAKIVELIAFSIQSKNNMKNRQS